MRAEIANEIMDAARAELAAGGPTGLSLRAVARRVEMVPSALYRYFPSRDALLTALIIDAYHAVGEAAEKADLVATARSSAEPMDRWLEVARTVRSWAGEHPHEWALIYGSPVTGYEAPRATVEAALRVTQVITTIFGDPVPVSGKAGLRTKGRMPAAPDDLRATMSPISDTLLPGRSPELAAAVLIAWTHLIGTVSLELFGHYKGATTSFDPVFDYTVRSVGYLGGLQ